MKINKKDINNIVINVWNSMRLDFNCIFNEIYSYMQLLSEKEINDSIAWRITLLNNIIKQRQLRNVIIDGMILSDINYASKFFNVNLYILINQYLFKYYPQYKSNIYRYINNTLYKIFSEDYINTILYYISSKLKCWLIHSCKKELSIINKNVIYF